MKAIVVGIILTLIVVQCFFQFSLDTINETGDIIVWYNWFGERKYFVLIEKLL